MGVRPEFIRALGALLDHPDADPLALTRCLVQDTRRSPDRHVEWYYDQAEVRRTAFYWIKNRYAGWEDLAIVDEITRRDLDAASQALEGPRGRPRRTPRPEMELATKVGPLVHSLFAEATPN